MSTPVEPSSGRPSGPQRVRRLPPAPALPAPAAAAATGLLIGGAAVGLVALGTMGCRALAGSPSCGGPGLFLLLAIMLALVVLGRALLRFADVPDPGVVSFLGVTVSVVVVLALFVDQTSSVWMWLVMPLLGAASFAVCHAIIAAAAKPASAAEPD